MDRYYKEKLNKKHIGRIMRLIGRIFVIFFLIGIILFSIVVTALTVYVMKATDSNTKISLEKDSIMAGSSVNVYGQDETGKSVKLSVMDSGVKRIWVDIVDVPKILKDAVIAIEDNKFYEHDGVDFVRTAGAVLNMFLHFWGTNQGGSTITQQLLKNITGERDVRGFKGVSRKVREICRAMSLEKKYSKNQILQAYLNIIYVGSNNYVGMKIAAKLYFNKDLKDINLQEAAALAALIKNPGKYNMLKNPNRILDRRNYVLNKMYNLGYITKQELIDAKNTEVVAKGGVIEKNKVQNTQSYFVDTVLNEVVSKYIKNNNNNIKDWNEANKIVKNNGLTIYTTIDATMQERLENEYENLKLAAKNVQSAFVVFDVNGNMKACVGGLGKKKAGDRSSFNYATNPKSLILPGSTMKAFVYAEAIDNNKVTYSSLFKDAPFKIVEGKPWPENYGNKHSNNMVTVKYAVQRSLNTVPTKILYDYGNKGIINFCDFLTNKLQISNIISPNSSKKDGGFETCAMAMGSLVKGVVFSEFVNAFQIFANGGTVRTQTTLKNVLTQDKNEFIKLNEKTTTAISKDSSVVMNRLLRNVVLAGGTGAAANLDSVSVECFGKTGTSNDGRHLLFIGGTPNYIAGIWFGSTNGKKITNMGINPSKIWGDIMKKLLKDRENKKKFSNVAAKEQNFCVDSGLICNASCPKKEKGYFKRDNILTKHCNIHK